MSTRRSRTHRSASEGMLIGTPHRVLMACCCFPGGRPPVTGSSLDTTLFHYAGAPLQQFNDTILKGNQGCSPHSPADYMSISSMVSSMQKSLS